MHLDQRLQPWEHIERHKKFQTSFKLIEILVYFMTLDMDDPVWALISVRLWNFKDGGSLKTSFLANNQHATKEKSLKNSYE